jgi:uncharacterized protein (TIGR00730 family)
VTLADLTALCVYCGSSVGFNPRHQQAARKLGSILAERGITLVYGGGRIGLMGVVADAVLAGGGRVVGIIPHHLDMREVGHRGASELHVVDSMHIRKQRMFELSDAFAVLPGGMGTLDETFEILTWRQIGLHDKPLILVNLDSYWDPLIEMIHHATDNGFANRRTLSLITVVERVEDIFEAVGRQPEPVIPCKPERF